MFIKYTPSNMNVEPSHHRQPNGSENNSSPNTA
jgi:hypothetical protein